MNSATHLEPLCSLLSVVIPAYNCAEYLERAVQSTQHLGVPGVEIIVVDDGSTDDTPSRVALIKQKFERVIAIQQRNAGLSAARNAGIARATGMYVLLLDADDELVPCDLMPLLLLGLDVFRIGLEEREISGLTRIWHDTREPTSGREYIRECFELQRFYPPSCSYIYRLQWLRTDGPQFVNGLLHEDELFTVQALLAAKTFLSTSLPVYRYIRREGSITLAVGDDRLRSRLRSVVYIVQQMVKMANSDPTIDLRWRTHFLIRIAASMAADCRSSWPRWSLVLTYMKLMLAYRGAGGHGFRYLNRQCLIQLLLNAWRH